MWQSMKLGLFSPAKCPWYFPKLPREIWKTCHHLTCPHPTQTFRLPERRAWGWRASSCQFLSWKWGDTAWGSWVGPGPWWRPTQRGASRAAGGWPATMKTSGPPSPSYGVGLSGHSSGSGPGPHWPRWTGLGPQHPQITCLLFSVSKVLNSSCHSKPCCRALLRMLFRGLHLK